MKNQLILFKKDVLFMTKNLFRDYLKKYYKQHYVLITQ